MIDIIVLKYLNRVLFCLLRFVISFSIVPLRCHRTYVTTLPLKSKKTNGFNSCIVMSVYPLYIPSMKKLQSIVIIDKVTY